MRLMTLPASRPAMLNLGLPYHAHYYQKDGRSANAFCGVFGFVCTQLQAQICGCTVAKHKGKRQCDDGHWHNYVCGTVAKVAYSSADEYLIYYII